MFCLQQGSVADVAQLCLALVGRPAKVFISWPFMPSHMRRKGFAYQAEKASLSALCAPAPLATASCPQPNSSMFLSQCLKHLLPSCPSRKPRGPLRLLLFLHFLVHQFDICSVSGSCSLLNHDCPYTCRSWGTQSPPRLA